MYVCTYSLIDILYFLYCFVCLIDVYIVYKNRDKFPSYQKELFYRLINEFLIVLSETEELVVKYPELTIDNFGNTVVMGASESQNAIYLNYLMNCRYIYRFIELLIDNLSMLLTRRYLKQLLISSNILFLIQCQHSLSPVFYEKNLLFKSLIKKLEFYINFSIDDWNGHPIDDTEQMIENYTKLQILQKACYKYFKTEMKQVAMSNVKKIGMF